MEYAVYDVFTDAPFGGNPLAVVFEASSLSTSEMQQIAREFNYSETTFVMPPDEQSHSALVRIFTPGLELAFAGHPIIGTAIALAEKSGMGPEMIFEVGVGPIKVKTDASRANLTTTVPLTLGEAPKIEKLAACLGLPKNAIRTDRHAPVYAGLGTDFVLIEMRDQTALAHACPDVAAFRKAAGPNADRLALYIYCRDGQHIDARMFQPLGGIPEDPATGSAAAALVSYLGHLAEQSLTFEISQGVAMGRPSQISASVKIQRGRPVTVEIAGSAVKMMEGKLSLTGSLA